MELYCGKKLVQPLFPGKIEHVLDEHNESVSITDATFDGLYMYSADAITSSCGEISLRLYSEKDPNKPSTKTLERKSIDAITADFQPYIEARNKGETVEK